MVRSIDWGRVRRELQEMSGIALRHVHVDRGFQRALGRSGPLSSADDPVTGSTEIGSPKKLAACTSVR